ncbi:MAG TPA: GNAT family N-acetyltransferase [Candidatus Scatomonas merdigallinarum]|nr:GNAT family N-acetyltransferase [Candidatus Scatomonas merdigallinarum]
MLQIRKMTGADAKTVLPMVYGFYRSDAVDHAVPEETLNRTFQAAVTDGSLLEGFVLEDETGAVGFAYLSPYYACEVGGVNMMLEEIFIIPEAQGKGYGTEFFRWMEETYPEVRRFRLEVTESNQAAVRLYKKLGYDFIRYEQMAKDRK